MPPAPDQLVTPRPPDTMSDTTDAPKKQGQRRRRRRGGRNRNNNQGNNNSNQSNRSQGSKGSKGSQGNKQGGGNSGGRRRSRNRGPRKPIKLSFWDKILIAIGLKEDPNKRKGKPQAKKSAKQSSAPKSNTRNARSKDDGDRPKSDSTRKRGDRGGRGTRDKNRRGGDPSTVESGRVYVGNLSYDVTEEDLKELFKGIGTVRRVEIVYNRNTHRSKGYGFVEMMNKDDAIRSVEVLDDQPFMGRNMTVSGAKNKEESTDPDELEPEMKVNAAEVELAPLPEKTEEQPAAEPATVPMAEAEVPAEPAAEIAEASEPADEPVIEAPVATEPAAEVEAPAQPAAEAPEASAEVAAESDEEEPKQA